MRILYSRLELHVIEIVAYVPRLHVVSAFMLFYPGGLSPQFLVHGEARSVCPEACAEQRSWPKQVKRRDTSAEQQSDQDLTESGTQVQIGTASSSAPYQGGPNQGLDFAKLAGP